MQKVIHECSIIGNSLLYVSKYVVGKGYTSQSNTSCNQLSVTHYFSFENNNICNKHTLQGNALLFRTHYQSFSGTNQIIDCPLRVNLVIIES